MAETHLARLHVDSGQTVALAIQAGAADVTVIETLTRNDQVALTIRPGSVIPAVSSALGRAILAFQPAEKRAAALAAPAPGLAGEAPRDVATVERMLSTVRERWYEVAVNERLPGVAALAAPVFDDRGQPVAAVSVIG
ncbi:MAG TPA: IclR family transcriptional regulator C-terminal domain-containing protein, partial [Ramlibacter sp.]|uniref:IclR family transcriptional regulator domain-containing protein n=1 Tax=Ramlibacter sp. TaxID=1917967 RepID=UPI002D7E8F79